MSDYYQFVGEFEDKFGETRKVHRDKGGKLRIAQTRPTPVLELNRAAAVLIGENIRRIRKKQDMTLEELCVKAGLSHASGLAKNRMWEIEKGARKGQGIRFGTLFALANALDVSPCAILPSKKEVFTAAGVKVVRGPETLAAG